MRRPESHAAPALHGLGDLVWEILVSLASGEKHGYAILLDIEQRHGRRLPVLPGSLYRALHRLESDGWVAEIDEAAARRDDPRRRVFQLTPAGRRAARAEARRAAARVRASQRLGWLAPSPAREVE